MPVKDDEKDDSGMSSGEEREQRPRLSDRDKTIARLAAGRREARLVASRVIEERDALQKQLDDIRGEVENLKLRADTNVERKRADALQAQLRDWNHKAKFRTAAQRAGADPEGIDDLYTLSGYKAESEDVDDDALDAVVETLKSSRPRYFASTPPQFHEQRDEAAVQTSQPPSSPAPAPAPKPAPRPAAATGRSGPSRGPSGPAYTDENLHDPKFMLGDGQTEVARAIKEGTFQYNFRPTPEQPQS